MINITNDRINFNNLEEKMWKIKMQEGIDELKTQLRKIDFYILKHKDNNCLKVKDFQETTIKCRFGDVKIFRRRYILNKHDGSKEYVYLLDKYLEFGNFGQFSQSIVELVMKEVVEKSYRKAAESIRNVTNLSITHNSARKILLDVVEKKIKPLEQRKLELYEKGFIEGIREKEIIFEESDGIFIARQKKNRTKKEKGIKLSKEAKIAIIHEGFEKRYTNDFKIKNKQIIATFDSAKRLKKLVDMTIGTTYAVHKLKKIIINADGAGWCKSIAESPIERYQLDMFHIQKKIREAIKNPEYLKLMSDIVKTDKPKDIFNVIYNYKVELDYDKKIEELKKVEELEKYLRNNQEGLLRYQYDLGYNFNELDMNIETEFRNLGTEESQVYSCCRKRMKKNRTSWSDDGAEGMIKSICYVKNNELDNLISGELEKKLEMELNSRIPQPIKIKKVKYGNLRNVTKRVIADNLGNFSRLMLKGLLREKSFNEMRLIGD